MLDLGDPRLRLRAHALTQLCKSEREKAITVYGFVKRIAFAKPLKMRLRTAREVLDAGRGDAPDKVVLLVSMLRLVGIPARIRYVELRGEILRGLTSNIVSAARPVAEIWLNQRWVRTDTYIFDADYVAAALDRLKADGWACGWGIHINAQLLWDGKNDAFLGGVPTERDPMLTRLLCVVSDPLELVSGSLRGNGLRYRRSLRALQWNALAPTMMRAIRELRAGSRFY